MTNTMFLKEKIRNHSLAFILETTKMSNTKPSGLIIVKEIHRHPIISTELASTEAEQVLQVLHLTASPT